MRKECLDLGKRCMNKSGLWKLVAIVFFVAFAVMTLNVLSLKRKNKDYCDMIVDMSDGFKETKEQEEELAEIRRRDCDRENSLNNKMTVEERLSENRIIEEE